MVSLAQQEETRSSRNDRQWDNKRDIAILRFPLGSTTVRKQMNDTTCIEGEKPHARFAFINNENVLSIKSDCYRFVLSTACFNSV